MTLLSAVAVAAGCGGSSEGGGYPASAKTKFLGGCEQRVSAATCTCEFDYIHKHVSFTTFAAADAALRNHTGGIPTGCSAPYGLASPQHRRPQPDGAR